jgi:hypothetical protein
VQACLSVVIVGMLVERQGIVVPYRGLAMLSIH